ncbi:acyl-CoA dehydrogenase, partial [Pseudomonas syringae]
VELRQETGASEEGDALRRVCDTLEVVLARVQLSAADDPEYPYRAAGDFLQLCGTALLAYAWARTCRCIQALPVDAPQRLENHE